MQGHLSLALAFTVLVTLATIGCDKKEKAQTSESSTTTDSLSSTTPVPGSKVGSATRKKSKTGGIPLDQIPYDPIKPEIKIDLAKFTSNLPANSPAIKEWETKKGKLAEVYGIMGQISANPKTKNEVLLVRDQFGTATISCEALFPPDWQKTYPGIIITVVGLVDIEKRKDGISIRLDKALVMATSNTTISQVTAEQLAIEYSANATEFDKKWNVSGKYYYVTGTLSRMDKVSGSDGMINRFLINNGAIELNCMILNEHGIEDDPPAIGSKVKLLLQCRGFDAKAKAISMTGVYVGKGQ
jgi:hypothetical protein